MATTTDTAPSPASSTQRSLGVAFILEFSWLSGWLSKSRWLDVDGAGVKRLLYLLFGATGLIALSMLPPAIELLFLYISKAITRLETTAFATLPAADWFNIDEVVKSQIL